MPEKRQHPSRFDLAVEQIRQGFFTDVYFNRVKKILEDRNERPNVLMQVFQKKNAWLGGMDEAIAVLKLCSGRFLPDGSWEPGWDRLTVRALYDGDKLAPNETVMTIEGDYSLFAHLETIYLGTLARGSLICTNVKRTVAAAGGKPIIMFGARHDHYRMQVVDGYAGRLGGIDSVSTDAQAALFGEKGVGTIPHSLIAAYEGDTVKATRVFADYFYPDINIVSLVDFDNDCVETSLAVARELKEKLWGVRLDNSDKLVDRSLIPDMGYFEPTGVPAELAFKVREALDANGFRHVKIIVSGGFTAAKIASFEEAGAPVDAYGVGSSLLRGENDYTADVVLLNGKPAAKVGRWFRPNERMDLVE
ncbi:MAG: quinolinate phosphoribosyl transferase [Thermoleophilia bacterium]|nr:quinolinate phosphoribosyl transferase [Thermoleophilia bacterium]